MTYSVIFSPSAISDLENIHAHIERDGGSDRAIAWIRGIREFCRGLETVPHRGTRRDHIAPGLRTIAYRKQATVAITISARSVTIPPHSCTEDAMSMPR
jgi:plasmid stabilization system protein ParE